MIKLSLQMLALYIPEDENNTHYGSTKIAAVALPTTQRHVIGILVPNVSRGKITIMTRRTSWAQTIYNTLLFRGVFQEEDKTQFSGTERKHTAA